VQCQAVKTLAVHCHCDVCSAAVGILQGVERPESVYSTMPQWGHQMVLQYVAASFHLPSVSTANINTVQYPEPYQEYEIPTIPAVVISKVLLPQSNIMAAFVHSNSSLFSYVTSGLPTYKNHVTLFTTSIVVVVVVVVLLSLLLLLLLKTISNLVLNK